MSTKEARFQCRHILADGHRCRAACLRHEEFCYYHHASRKPVADPADRKSRRAAFVMPRIEDRASMQNALNDVIARIAANDIDPRRAGRLLFAIQIASRNMPRPPALNTASSEPRSKDYDDAEPGPVEEIVVHPVFGEIAPRSEITPPIKGKRFTQLLREEIEELEVRNIAEFGPDDDDPPPPPTPTPTGPRTNDLEAELREVREDLAKAKAQLAEATAEVTKANAKATRAKAEATKANADTLYAEKVMVWHMDRASEALAQLESLKSATQPPPEAQPATLPLLQAVAASHSEAKVRVPHPLQFHRKGWGIVCGSKRPFSHRKIAHEIRKTVELRSLPTHRKRQRRDEWGPDWSQGKIAAAVATVVCHSRRESASALAVVCSSLGHTHSGIA